MRILLFLATNLAVLILVSLVFNLLGLEGVLAANGVDLNLQGLLIFCALFGFGGSFISLLLSKWMAKRGTGTQIISSPRNRDEQWLVETTAQLAAAAIDQRLLLVAAGPRVLRMVPPLVISRGEVQELLKRLEATLATAI